MHAIYIYTYLCEYIAYYMTSNNLVAVYTMLYLCIFRALRKCIHVILPFWFKMLRNRPWGNQLFWMYLQMFNY